MVVVEVRGSSYFMHPGLKSRWDKIKDGHLTKLDEDRCYVVDGRERSGKSLFTIQQASYIDPTILDDAPDGTVLPRITYSSKETLKAIRETKSTKDETRVIIFDEAFRGMSSKGALSKENKMLTAALMEMGQSNLVLFIVSPSFFLLELYPAVLRTNALFHVSKDKKSNRRMVKAFNYRKKAVLYQVGIRKGWGYPIRTKQKTNFFNIYPGGKEFEDKYRKKKLDSLRCTEKDENEVHRWRLQRDTIITYLYNTQIKSVRKLSEWLKSGGVPISPAQISLIVGKGAENAEKLAYV